MRKKHSWVKLFIVAWIFFFVALPLHAGDRSGLSSGQTVYVPAYSHIYSGDREKPFLLTVTLSLRNIDPRHEVKITRIEYYETQGRLLKKLLDKPVTLKPLESTRYVIPQKDKSGGSGANFIVAWQSEKAMNPPIIESVMIGAQNQQGVSFTSRGQVILPSE